VIRLALLAICLAAPVASASDASESGRQASGCGHAERLRALDFWLGRWTVTSEGETAGTNIIEPVLNGCAVTERWTGANGHAGFSLFYFDRHADAWKQVWVTDDSLRVGGTKEKIEQHALTSPSRIRFQGQYPGRQPGATVSDRTTLTRLPDGSVRQLIEVSTDGGKSWKTTFDGLYRPIAPID
jgi:hypothetical protein